MHTEDRARFKKIGEKGDAKLHGKTVAVAGIGSVGSSIATILAREDIDLRIVDMGRVEETDMHRLALFYEEDITKFKVKQAKARLAAINPKVHVKSFHEELAGSNIFLLEGDCIVDATNNDDINRLTLVHAAKKKYPLVMVRCSGAAVRILVLHKSVSAKILDKVALPPTEKDGIFGPATTLAATIAVTQVMRSLLGDKQNLLIACDAWEPKVKITKL